MERNRSCPVWASLGWKTSPLLLLSLLLGLPAWADPMADYQREHQAFTECLQRGKATETCGELPKPPPIPRPKWPVSNVKPHTECGFPYSWIASALDVSCEPPGSPYTAHPCGGPKTDYVPGVSYCARDNQESDRRDQAVAVGAPGNLTGNPGDTCAVCDSSDDSSDRPPERPPERPAPPQPAQPMMRSGD